MCLEDCDCESSESSRICIEDGFAIISFETNFDYCEVPEDEIVEDLNCGCEYDSWEDDNCISSGYMRQIRYEITDFEYCEDEIYQILENEICNCNYTEWQDDACLSEGYMRQIREELSGYEYCNDDLERSVENGDCDCDYSCWNDIGCVDDGIIRQQRIESSGFEYCNANLIQEINDANCNCVPTELSRECVGNNTAFVNYLWNYPYCGPDSEEVYDINCYICESEWKCDSFTECQEDGYRYCTSVYDIHDCGETYCDVDSCEPCECDSCTACGCEPCECEDVCENDCDYFKFREPCNYCAAHSPLINIVDEITVIEGDLITLNVDVSDPDNDEVLYSISSPVGNDGEWQTKKGDKGTYKVVITATDGLCVSSKTVKIIVKEKPYQSLIVERTAFEEFLRAGDEQQLHITLENMGNIDIKDLKITVLVDTLGIWKKTPAFDIDAGDEKTLLLRFDIPFDAYEGTHYMRIVLSNDKIRRVLYRDLDII